MTKKVPDGSVRQPDASALAASSSSSSSSSTAAVGVSAIQEDFGDYPGDDLCAIVDLPRGAALGAPLARLVGSLVRVRDGSILQAKHDLVFWIRQDGSLQSLAAISLTTSFGFMKCFQDVTGIPTVLGAGSTGTMDSQLSSVRRAIFSLLVRGAAASPVQVQFSVASDWGATFPEGTNLPAGAVLAIASVPPLSALSPLPAGPAAGDSGGRRRSSGRAPLSSSLLNRDEVPAARVDPSGAGHVANVVDLACDEELSEHGEGSASAGEDSRSRASTTSQVMVGPFSGCSACCMAFVFVVCGSSFGCF